MTRVKRREDLLIYRPFERTVFTGGPPDGPTLLLRTLRGEEVDWSAIEEKLVPRKRCNQCGERQPKEAYAAAEWKDP